MNSLTKRVGPVKCNAGSRGSKQTTSFVTKNSKSPMDRSIIPNAPSSNKKKRRWSRKKRRKVVTNGDDNTAKSIESVPRRKTQPGPRES